MAIHFATTTPQTLLNNFDARIAQTEPKGKITTWEKASDGHYTHKATEWNKKAWLLPKVLNSQLTFNIIRPNGSNVTSQVYAYYHGHLIETFLNHFDTSFSNAVSSALPESADHCTA
ncbi:MAG: hypothetical protein ABI171_06505 [Collimonas sp.]|uniref:hypothetical protein n=1 Tax=Collimonas sp. TaxID=1963772 RepID=UPI003263AC18